MLFYYSYLVLAIALLGCGQRQDSEARRDEAESLDEPRLEVRPTRFARGEAPVSAPRQLMALWREGDQKRLALKAYDLDLSAYGADELVAVFTSKGQPVKYSSHRPNSFPYGRSEFLDGYEWALVTDYGHGWFPVDFAWDRQVFRLYLIRPRLGFITYRVKAIKASVVESRLKLLLFSPEQI